MLATTHILIPAILTMSGKFHIDWKGETSGRVRVNINRGAMVDSFAILENKYVAESWAKNAKKNLENKGYVCTLILDEGRVD